MASWSTWLSLVHTSSGPWFEPRTCQKQKCCLFSSVRTPDITQQQNQLPGCFLVLQHHFLSLPRPSLEKDSRCKGGEKGYEYMPPKGPQTMVETILLWSVTPSAASARAQGYKWDGTGDSVGKFNSEIVKSKALYTLKGFSLYRNSGNHWLTDS